MIQAAGAWDSGEVVEAGMLSGAAQLAHARKQAGLQSRSLSQDEKFAIQRRRAESAERRRQHFDREAAESRRQGAEELKARLSRRRAASDASEADADEAAARAKAASAAALTAVMAAPAHAEPSTETVATSIAVTLAAADASSDTVATSSWLRADSRQAMTPPRLKPSPPPRSAPSSPDVTISDELQAKLARRRAALEAVEQSDARAAEVVAPSVEATLLKGAEPRASASQAVAAATAPAAPASQTVAGAAASAELTSAPGHAADVADVSENPATGADGQEIFGADGEAAHATTVASVGVEADAGATASADPRTDKATAEAAETAQRSASERESKLGAASAAPTSAADGEVVAAAMGMDDQVCDGPAVEDTCDVSAKSAAAGDGVVAYTPDASEVRSVATPARSAADAPALSTPRRREAAELLVASVLEPAAVEVDMMPSPQQANDACADADDFSAKRAELPATEALPTSSDVRVHSQARADKAHDAASEEVGAKVARLPATEALPSTSEVPLVDAASKRSGPPLAAAEGSAEKAEATKCCCVMS
eukprot:TRINITY_DN21454_c0_g1_i1.p1 TRINITY_DN21454_c0_g1~~TRINITY_DN21454_c0_g1_i1.p1  ORF type:complete len:545 (-),score=165.55 TRINITY_DN21454_c0_g1_i1:292-1926(-)